MGEPRGPCVWCGGRGWHFVADNRGRYKTPCTLCQAKSVLVVVPDQTVSASEAAPFSLKAADFTFEPSISTYEAEEPKKPRKAKKSKVAK